jgi:hypothetical protein
VDHCFSAAKGKPVDDVDRLDLRMGGSHILTCALPNSGPAARERLTKVPDDRRTVGILITSSGATNVVSSAATLRVVSRSQGAYNPQLIPAQHRHLVDREQAVSA